MPCDAFLLQVEVRHSVKGMLDLTLTDGKGTRLLPARLLHARSANGRNRKSSKSRVIRATVHALLSPVLNLEVEECTLRGPGVGKRRGASLRCVVP